MGASVHPISTRGFAKCQFQPKSKVILAALAALLPFTASAGPLAAEDQAASEPRFIPPIIISSPLGDLAGNASHGAFGPKLKRTYVSAIEFHSLWDGSGLSYWASGYYHRPYSRQASAGPVFRAPVQLPDGALLCYLGLYASDNNTLATRLYAQLVRTYGGFQTIGAIPAIAANISYDDTVHSTGIGVELAAVDVGGAGFFGYPNCVTINNDVLHGGNQYAINVGLPDAASSGDDGKATFKAVELGWYRQISPAPGAATFLDVPTSHTFFQAIEALSAAGVTTGCGGGNFCPGQTVNRGQMAAFLARALGL